jgi:hypothetical protein
MTVTPAALVAGSPINIADTVLYQCPVNTKAFVTTGVFVNTDAVARLLYLRIVRSGGSPSTYLVKGQSIAAGKSYVSPEVVNQVLTEGDQIVGNSDADAVITAIAVRVRARLMRNFTRIGDVDPVPLVTALADNRNSGTRTPLRTTHPGTAHAGRRRHLDLVQRHRKPTPGRR